MNCWDIFRSWAVVLLIALRGSDASLIPLLRTILSRKHTENESARGESPIAT